MFLKESMGGGSARGKLDGDENDGERGNGWHLFPEKCFAGSAVVGLDWGEMMNVEELARSAGNDDAPPGGISIQAKALWYARAGEWDAAHDLCQDVPGAAGSWIHAWLHRQEGDLGNAGYWYSRAGREMPQKGVSLEDEWMGMARELVG